MEVSSHWSTEILLIRQIMVLKKRPSLYAGFSLVEVIIALAIFGFLIGGLMAFLPWGVDGVSKIKDRNTAMSLIDATQIELERLGFSVVEAGTHRLDGLYEPTGTPIDAAKVNQLILVARRSGGVVSFEQVIQSNQSEESNGLLKIDKENPNAQTEFQKDSGGRVYFDSVGSANSDIPVSLKEMEKYNDQNTEEPFMNRWIEEKDRYFRLVCTQFASSSRHVHDVSNGYLALEVEVQWPYKLFNAENAPPKEDREIKGDIEERFRSSFVFPIAIYR